MQDLKEKIAELVQKFSVLASSFDLEAKKLQLQELELASIDPNLWQDQDRAKKTLQETSDLKNDIVAFKILDEEIKILSQFAYEKVVDNSLIAEFYKTAKALDNLILKSFLSGTYDGKNALVSIHAGQGGTEAMDWTSMLTRMYLRFCERRGWKTEVLDSTSGEEAGIKSITFRVNGAYAYGYLRNESGTHRLVRQSPFNADNLRQTSFALVEVLPELAEVDLPDINISEDDIETQFFHSSSQGGQNVQKVSTAVRIIHKPTGIVVTAQAERFQEQNRKNALNLLRAKLWLRQKETEAATKKEIKGEYRPASWGNQIRSYVLHPYKMVKDLRTEVETSDTVAVLDGEINDFIEAELKLG